MRVVRVSSSCRLTSLLGDNLDTWTMGVDRAWIAHDDTTDNVVRPHTGGGAGAPSAQGFARLGSLVRVNSS